MLMPIAQRIAPLGWHLQLLMPADVLQARADMLSALPVPLVFDHFAQLSPADTGRFIPRTPWCCNCCRQARRGSSCPAAIW